MYSRRERPLSPAERQQLTERLRGRADEMGGSLGVWLAMACVDLLMIALAVLSLIEGRSVNICGGVCWGFCFLTFNMWLVGAVSNVFAHIRERRRIRQALADGVAVVERVAARRTVNLRWAVDYEWRVLLAVSDEAVLMLPNSQTPVTSDHTNPDPKGGSMVPAFFESVTTRWHRLPLGLTTIGRSGSPYTSALDLVKVIPDPQSRRRILNRLTGHSLLLRGTLANLPALLESETFEGDVLGDGWDELQARVEQSLGVTFGPRGLARLQPKTMSDLVDLLVQRLPTVGRVWPVRGAFYQLRAALAELLNAERGTIRPGTPLASLIPERGRRQTWQRLGERLGRPLPGFARHSLPGCSMFGWLMAVISCLMFGAPSLFLLQSAAGAYHFGRQAWIEWGVRLVQVAVVVLTGCAVCVMGLAVWRQRRHREFDAQYATVGQVARFMADEEPGVELPWTEERVFLTVRRIVAEVKGCRPMDVSWTMAVVE